MLKTYAINITRCLADAEFQWLLPFVSSKKQSQIERLQNFADKQRSLLGELLARTVLSSHLKVATSELVFANSQHGKPNLLGYPNTHFNISHSGNHVVCAVSDAPVGLDVEQIGVRDFHEIATRFFHIDEKAYIESRASTELQTIAFSEIWTKKEAYIKFNGRGLRIPLSSFSVLTLPEVTFHKVFLTTEVICHVCSNLFETPEFMNYTIDEFISNLGSLV